MTRLAAAVETSRFESYLIDGVDAALAGARDRAQHAGRDAPDAAARRRAILGVLEQRLLDHPDLAPLLGTGTRRGAALRDRIADTLAAAPPDGAAGGRPDAASAAPVAPGTTGATGAPTPSDGTAPSGAPGSADGAGPPPNAGGRRAPALGVAVEAGVLARLPDGMLDRMKVHTSMRGLRWKMVRDDDGTPDYVLHPED